MIAAIYARKSSDQNVAEDAKSVTRQVENAKAFAAENGWQVEDRFVFVDDGVSGAEFERRPGFVALMDALRPTPPFQRLVMSEESRLGRNTSEVPYAFGRLVKAGVEVWCYRDRRRISLDTPIEKFMVTATSFAADMERWLAQQRSVETMLRKARAGHVVGGRVFGYENIRVDGHVERRIVDAEAAVVREIFRRSADGEGLRTIAKALNLTDAPAPRSQQGRSRGWSPSSVRAVLHRTVYRGVVTWNRTKKRDIDGQQRQQGRPQAEWITLPAEGLRIVDDAMWQVVHGRLRSVHASASAAPPLVAGRGIRQRYLLSGFSRCVRCGGSMQAVSRSSSLGRSFRYVCATYWNRGATACANGLMAAMPETDRAVRDFLQTEVLQPRIIERALDIAMTTLRQRHANGASRVENIRHRVSRIERELANLAEATARDGAIPAVLEALRHREDERRRLAADLANLNQRPSDLPVRSDDIRARLQRFLKDWNGLLAEDAAGARRLMEMVLTDRIRFAPDSERRRYQLTIPVGFNRLIVAVVPALRQGLQEMMASPPGFEPGFQP